MAALPVGKNKKPFWPSLIEKQNQKKKNIHEIAREI